MKAGLNEFKNGYKKVFEKKEEMKEKLSRIDTELDGIEAYVKVLSMDDRLKDDKNIRGIFHQIDIIRDLLN